MDGHVCDVLPMPCRWKYLESFVQRYSFTIPTVLGSIAAVCTCKVLTSKATQRCCSDFMKSLKNLSSRRTPATGDDTIDREDEFVEHEPVVGVAQNSPQIRAVNEPSPILLSSQPRTNNFGSSDSRPKHMFYPDIKSEYKLIPLATAAED